MSAPDMESPPALGAEGQCIAVGASAEPIYTIRAIRAIIQGAGCAIADLGGCEFDGRELEDVL